MKVGDLVTRKVNGVDHCRAVAAIQQREMLGIGIVLAKQMAGSPAHPCVTVFYPKVRRKYDIAESLLVVLSESR